MALRKAPGRPIGIRPIYTELMPKMLLRLNQKKSS